MQGIAVATLILVASSGCATSPVPSAGSSVGPRVAASPASRSSRSAAEAPTRTARAIDFDDLLPASAAGTATRGRLALETGERVRIVGFMAHMEVPPATGFFLTRHPVACDEAGGGSADLPPDAVRVLGAAPPSAAGGGAATPYLPGRLEVRGKLELGHREEPDGTVSRARIVLDQ